MMLVLLIHYVPSRTTPSPESLHNDFWGTVCNLELRSLSFVCVNCFVLISGYFGIRWKLKSFANLIFQVIFWLIVGVLFHKVMDPGFDGGWLESSWGYLKARWFVSAYVCLYVVAPMINAFVEKSSQRELGLYLIMFYLFSTIYGYFILAQEFNEGMSMISLVGIYLSGAYLRKFELKITQFSLWQDLMTYICLGLVLVAGSLALLAVGINKSIYGYLNPLIVVQAIYLFLFFKKLNIGHIGWINFIAASAFAVYLFHMHPLIYGKYQEVCHYINDTYSITAPYVVLLFAGIFIFCVIVDRIRIFLFDLIAKILPI